MKKNFKDIDFEEYDCDVKLREDFCEPEELSGEEYENWIEHLVDMAFKNDKRNFDDEYCELKDPFED